MSKSVQLESGQDYYGRMLASKNDLKTTACRSAVAPPAFLREALAMVYPEVRARFYGCGVPRPVGVVGARVLDLGSGPGRDCFVVSNCVINLSPDKPKVFADRRLDAACSGIPWCSGSASRVPRMRRISGA